jgi:hypothetical protein
MARVNKVNDLEARKRALVAESDLCRQALKADLDDLRDYSSGFFQKVDRVRSLAPWILGASVPLALPLMKLFKNRTTEKPRSSTSGLKGKFATLMMGWRLYRQYGPMVRSALNQFQAKRRSASSSRSVSPDR